MKSSGLLCLVVLSSVSCASLEPFSAPGVSLVNIEFADLTLFETSGVFTVRISNENPDPVVVDGAVYNLYLGGLKVGRALSDRRLEVPRLGSATYEVDLYINNLALATRLIPLIESQVLDYRVKGKLYVERPYGLRRMRFSRDGRLDLRGKPPGKAPLEAPLEAPGAGTGLEG